MEQLNDKSSKDNKMLTQNSENISMNEASSDKESSNASMSGGSRSNSFEKLGLNNTLLDPNTDMFDQPAAKSNIQETLAQTNGDSDLADQQIVDSIITEGFKPDAKKRKGGARYIRQRY